MADEQRLKQARLKAARFCSFRERSPKEVEDKLKQWGLTKVDRESIIQTLRKEGFVDEQRFANAFCHDKFEFNGWGKLKIKAQLFPHQLDAHVVEHALERINNQDYNTKLKRLATQKWEMLEKDDESKRKQKTLRFLTSKGYETDLIWKSIYELSK